MKKIFQLLIAVSILALISGQMCSSDSRCTCVPLVNNSYKAQCLKFSLTFSTFPHFYKNVREIVLNDNNIQELPFPLYRYLPESIEKIFIEFNNIHHLGSTTFLNLSKLTYIGFAKNNLHYIEQGTFLKLPSLRFLDLSANTYLTFRVLPNITYDLQFTNILFLHLNDIHCASGIRTNIFVEDVEYLANTSIQEMHLTHNRIGYIESGVISALPKTLLKLNLSLNSLAVGPYILEISLMTGLTYLNIGEVAGFGGHNAEIDCNDWRCPKIHNARNIPKTQDNPVIKWSLPPNLKEFLNTNSMAKGDIKEMIFRNNSVEKIDIHGNNHRQWIGPLKNLHNLKYLDMSDVRCSHISEDFFSDFPVLEILKINNNTLGSVLASDENGTIFRYLKQLKYLEIANNFIFSLSENIFKNLSSLEMLDLSSNYMTNWKISIAHMRNLKFINLSVNRLQNFSVKTMKEIDDLLKRSHLNINLKDNPLTCTCGTLAFLRWMLKHSHIFVDFNSYRCQIEGKFVDFKELEIQFHNIEERCSEYTGLIIGLCVAVVMCFFVTICGVVYRYRWRLRYMYYLGRRYEKKYENKQVFNFDAFISYADEDSNDVIRISETLENSLNLRLQLHQRDFIAGRSIAENIANTIHKCRKSVIMLSANFLRSSWCMFEFHIARMESIHSREGSNVIIIVFLEPIRSRDIPVMMMDVIQSDSYVEYFKNDQQFCEKLQAAINNL